MGAHGGFASVGASGSEETSAGRGPMRGLMLRQRTSSPCREFRVTGMSKQMGNVAVGNECVYDFVAIS